MTKSTRTCPDCGDEMYTMDLEGVEVELCARCSGMWLDQGELVQASGEYVDTTFSADEASEAGKSRRNCPDSGTTLWRRSFTRGAPVMVDQCPQCGGMFLDEGELSKIQTRLKAAREWEENPPVETAATHTSDNGDDTAYLSENTGALVAFQFLTGLPLELHSRQRLWSPNVTPLLLANIFAFATAWYFGLNDAVQRFGMVPAEITGGQRLWTMLTGMFMHAGPFHLLANMYFLFVTGDNVEERLGGQWFLTFYLACGMVAAMAHIIANPASTTPCVGASGAIAGVMGAYIVFFPRNRFLVRWVHWMRVRSFEIPAWAYFGFWVLVQLTFALTEAGGSTAVWAHVGGFMMGAAISLAIRLVDAQYAPTEAGGWTA